MDYDDFDIESKFLRNMPIFIHVRFLPSIMLCFTRTESIRYILKKKIKSNYFHEKFYIVLVTKVSMAVFYNKIVGITRVLKAWVMVLSLRWFSYHCLSSLNMFHFGAPVMHTSWHTNTRRSWCVSVLSDNKLTHNNLYIFKISNTSLWTMPVKMRPCFLKEILII